MRLSRARYITTSGSDSGMPFSAPEAQCCSSFDSRFNITLILATQLTGFGLAGLCRRLLVYPASMVWPQNLVACTLLNTLHAEEDATSGGITRYRFFMWGVAGAFVFFFLPGEQCLCLCMRRHGRCSCCGRVPVHGVKRVFVGMLDGSE